MVLSYEEGRYPRCPICLGRINDEENVGVIDKNEHLYHSDCFRDKYGHNMAIDEKEYKENGWDRVATWAHFDKRGRNPHGARFIA